MMNTPTAADGGAETRPIATPLPDLTGREVMVKIDSDNFADHGIAEGDLVVIDPNVEPEHGDVVLAIEGDSEEERPVIATFEPEKNGCPDLSDVLGVAIKSLTVNELRRNNDDS